MTITTNFEVDYKQEKPLRKIAQLKKMFSIIVSIKVFCHQAEFKLLLSYIDMIIQNWILKVVPIVQKNSKF